VAEFEWDFFDRVVALADELGPGSADDFPARLPGVFPEGMQYLTGLDYDLSDGSHTAYLTLTMASREHLVRVSGVEVTPEQHQMMSEEIAVALAFATLRLLDAEAFDWSEVTVVGEAAVEGDEPLALVGCSRLDLGAAPFEGMTRFEFLGGVSRPAELFTSTAAERTAVPASADPSLLDPRAFELLVKDLLEAMGLTARETPYSKDDGVDVIAEDHRPFHRGRVVVQAKRYAGSVGVTTVRELNGVLPLHRAQRGIIVTTGTFTREAVSTAGVLGIELIDGVELRQALAEHLPG